MNNNELGNFLKEKRLSLNLSLREASKLIGISHSYLSIIEKGEDPRNNTDAIPRPETLKKISDAYNVGFTYLLKIGGYLDLAEEKIANLNYNDEEADIEVLLKSALDLIESQDHLVLSGKILNHNDFERVKTAILVSLNFIKQDMLK